MTPDLTPAIAAGILTVHEANAISGAIIRHPDGAIEMRRENLTDDQLDALDRAIVWMDACEVCGK